MKRIRKGIAGGIAEEGGSETRAFDPREFDACPAAPRPLSV